MSVIQDDIWISGPEDANTKVYAIAGHIPHADEADAVETGHVQDGALCIIGPVIDVAEL
jgi:hypothetical protein